VFSQAIADDICQQLAEGKSLRATCAAEGMPAESTVRARARDHAAFGAQYARAREQGYEVMGDSIIEISDEGEDVARDRLRVDARKWLLSKMLPKVYGDKLETTVKGGPANVMLSATDAAL